MATQYLNVLGQEDIDLLLNLPDVVNAKTTIDAKASGSVSLSVPLPASIKDALYKSFGLDLDTVPMRWIKGDTRAHNDMGAGQFQNTYLVYLTDSQGELIVDGASYPITQGTGYVFPEGLSHETLNTGSEPRLLLGPMSETGFAVGSGIYRPGGTTIYFRQTGVNIEYSIDDKASWIGIGNNFPIVIGNTDTAAGTLIVEFVGNITIDDNVALGIYKYFICGSSDIQFGSSSLNPDGSRPVITINVDNYDGLIENGDEVNPGQNNIYVYNLIVEASGRTPQIGAGWIGRKGFANSATYNYIINCSSTGDLPGGAVGSGGIVGAFAGKGAGAQLTIIGCSSSGLMGQLDGGIVGAYAGKGGGYVTCEQCWSTGVIGDFAGGIFGDYAGDAGYAEATNCYSMGTIGVAIGNAGGIFGRFAGNAGQAIAQKCYSRGDIAASGGGIFSIGAASDGGSTNAINCYSVGTIGGDGAGGIYGSGKAIGGQTTNCYAANGSWSSSAANSQLEGVPIGGVVGDYWVATVINEPYELVIMGYTPYSINNIVKTELLKIYEQTIEAGQATVSSVTADASGNSFIILEINGADPNTYNTITIPNQQTGSISTTSATVPGTYTLVIRSVGSYNITTFTLTVTAVVTATGEIIQIPCCAVPSNVTGEDYDIQADTLAGNAIIANFPARRGPISYTALLKMKIASASKRR